jgi:transcriptional regulator
MLIHPWDAALDEAEWRDWLGDGHDFGELAVNHPGHPPFVVPTHFALEGDNLLVHLAATNSVWPAIEAQPRVLMSVADDYAFIPSTWRADAGGPDEDGVPTSYYAAVQFACAAEIVDDPQGKADLLTRQLSHFQPEGRHAMVAVGQPPYGQMLADIRGLRLKIESVAAKFKYDDRNPRRLRETVADRLDLRQSGRDAGAATQQRRRLRRIGDWRS